MDLSAADPVTGPAQAGDLLWDDLAGRVRILATQLRSLGAEPGDRVASMLPNIPEICTGGYSCNGKAYDRSGELSRITDDLDCLRVAAHAFNETGEPVVDEVGEW